MSTITRKSAASHLANTYSLSSITEDNQHVLMHDAPDFEATAPVLLDATR